MNHPEATCDGETAAEAIRRSTHVTDRIRERVGMEVKIWEIPLEQLLGLFEEEWEKKWCRINHEQAIRNHKKYG